MGDYTEYVTFEIRNILTILVPLTLIFMKIVDYLELYHENNKVIHFRRISVIFSISSTALFYALDFDNYFCFTWLLVSFISPFYYSFINRKVTKIPKMKIDDELRWYPKLEGVLSIFIGLFLIFLPYTRLFFLIGGGRDIRVTLISRILYFLLGTSLIILNKYVLHKLYLYRRIRQK